MRRASPAERVLATVLFTDIVGSTELATKLGDRRWRDLVRRHHAAVRAQLKRHRGREVDTAGDGFFAVFEHPAQAIDCAVAIVAVVRSLGLEVRAGIHTGEVERTGSNVGGIAVHIGARVMATAGAGDIVVTSTVKDLVKGSEHVLTDRGVATLRGVDGEWRLHGVLHPSTVLTEADEQEGPSTEARRRRSSRASVVLAIVGLGALGLSAAALALPRVLSGPLVPGPDTVARIRAGGDAFDLAVKVGKGPGGIAVGDGAIWVINIADQTLSRIDPETGLADANPAVGGTPSGVAAGEGGIWVSTHFGLAAGETGSVVPFDRRAIRDRPIPVSSGVEAIAVGDGSVWVADRVHDVVRRIDPGTKLVEPSELPVGRSPGAIAVGAGSLWVTSSLDATIWRIDPGTAKVAAKIALNGPPTAIAVDSSAVWVAAESADAVTRIDPATNTPITTVTGLDAPRSVAVAKDSVWVALGRERAITRIDPATNTVVQTLRLAGVPTALVVDEAGAVWVAVRDP